MLQPFFHHTYKEAGCDEAGRGCLAGPVFAAAVILPKKFRHPLLNDSKQLKHDQRMSLREVIIREAECFAVAHVDEREIDRINILQASFKAMHLAIDALSCKPEWLLIDGNRFVPYFGISHTCIIKGDGKYSSIAAASILAKTARDEWMQQCHEEFPEYGWWENKGYGTPKHLQALHRLGETKYHRKTFNWRKSAVIASTENI